MRVILYQPIYDQNVGMVARVVKNFGFRELYIIQPIARLGTEAEVYAKHAKDVLAGAKIVDSWEEAVEGLDMVVGTTANLRKGLNDVNRPRPLSEVREILQGKVGVVFGREDNGLPVDVLAKTDINTFIETSDEYPSLNLANSVAVVLYVLRRGERCVENPPSSVGIREMAVEYFERLARRVKLRNREKCVSAFKNVLIRSRATENEIRSIIKVLKENLKL